MKYGILSLLALLVSPLLNAQCEQIFITAKSQNTHAVLIEVNAALSASEFTITRTYSFPEAELSLWVFQITTEDLAADLKALQASPSILTAEIDAVATTLEVEKYEANDAYVSNLWHADNRGVNGFEDADIDLAEGWMLEQGSPDVVLAIFDTGLKLDHPEFGGRFISLNDPQNGIDDDGNGYIDDEVGYDFVDYDYYPADLKGHGTAVAGIAAANGDNNIGFAGIDWNCKLMVVRVLDEYGRGNYSDIVAGIYYAVNNGADVINMSLGGSTNSTAMASAITYAHNNGLLVIAASGNTGDQTVNYPSAYPEVMAVGATNWYDWRCDPYTLSGNGGSNYGSHISVVAPGDVIPHLSYSSNTDYSQVNSGTSFAAPMVSGLACLLKAQDPTRTNDEIRDVIERTAEDMVGYYAEDERGWDIFYGFGRINVYLALTEQASYKGKNAVLVYPNPVVDKGHFLVHKDATEVNIASSDGRIVYYDTQLSEGSHPLPDLVAGWYVLSVISEGSLYTSAFIVL